jgi:hypothetical protein
MRSVVALLLAGMIAVAACGGDDVGVSEPAARLLHAQVTAVRTAAASRDRAGAAEQLASLRTNLTRLRKQGEISGDAAARIGRAADAVAAQLTLIPLPTTTTTTTAPPRDDEGGPKPPGHGPDKKGPGHEKPRPGGPKDEQD